jgi:hypothetical protein
MPPNNSIHFSAKSLVEERYEWTIDEQDYKNLVLPGDELRSSPFHLCGRPFQLHARIYDYGEGNDLELTLIKPGAKAYQSFFADDLIRGYWTVTYTYTTTNAAESKTTPKRSVGERQTVYIDSPGLATDITVLCDFTFEDVLFLPFLYNNLRPKLNAKRKQGISPGKNEKFFTIGSIGKNCGAKIEKLSNHDQIINFLASGYKVDLASFLIFILVAAPTALPAG